MSKKLKKKLADDSRIGYTVLAVTACPTGIAHTYMAAESLNGKAEENGNIYKS